MVEDNWPSVSANLWKAQKVWYCLSRILGREGTVAKTLGRFLHRSFPGNYDIWIGDMGSDPPHGEDPGEVSPPGGETDHVKTPPVSDGRDMVLPSVSGGNAVSGSRGD